MAANVDKKQHYRTIEKTCYGANIIYLILHIFYLVLFIVNHYDILAYVTGGIIAIYILFFFLIKARKYYIYALCCGNLFFGYISVTTIMLGFNTGFHFYLIGLCVVSFFTTYFSKVRNIKGSIVWVGLSLAIYLTLYLVTSFNKPYYENIPQWLEMTLFITHAVVVFGFIAIYLVVFLRYAMSLENKIVNESRTDELTQISNRYGLYDYFENEDDKSNLVLALFDIDDFKNINDTYGHAVGDDVLTKVANLAVFSLKDSFVCRYGGEEFVIVLRNEGKYSFFDKLEEFRKSVEKESFEVGSNKMKITVTIGAAKYTNGISLEKWIELADERMYTGKNTGKNKTVI